VKNVGRRDLGNKAGNWVLAAALAGVSAVPLVPRAGERQPVVRPGWDWTLPAGLKPAPYSGFVSWGRRFDPAISVCGIQATWKRLNPAPGVYNWEWIERQLSKNAAMGVRSGIHLKGVERTAVPDWVIDRFRPVVVDVPPLQENQPWRIRNVLPWQPNVDRAFHEFLREFGRRGIARRKDVVYGYIHGISASRGEEMFIRRVDLKMWQETTGLTAKQFADWLKHRIDAMCEAFKGVEYKLALMFAGPIGPTVEFREATAGLVDYAFSKGTGIRGGGIDFMHGLFDSPGWASRLTPDGYCIVDDDHPVIRERRFRGDENEEYGKYWVWRFGPVEGYPYRHRISTLRGLQMRQNFQYVSPATLKLNPALNEYARVAQGYRRDDSPDAWAYLRECAVRRHIVRNIERWLVQRDQPGSRTIPAERIDRYPIPADPKTRHYDFDARRTDAADGQTGILFRLDRVFWSRPGPATVKVTYTDRAAVRWWIRYTDRQGRLTNTASVQNTGDGQRKTATFHIDSLAALGRFPNDPAFRKWANALPEDPPNLVKNAQLAGDAGPWQLPAIYRIIPDPEQTDRRRVEFTYKRFDDTVHMDQLLRLQGGIPYQLKVQIRNDGVKLRPAARIARMDWSTMLYLKARTHGKWETLSGIFTPEKDGMVRLQLFGQGRGNYAPGLAGKSYFRNIEVRQLPRNAVLRGREMDFRVETAGPGDLTVTLVRVVKGIF